MNILIDSWAWIEICEGSEKGAKVLNLIYNLENKTFTTTANIYEVWYQIVKRFGRKQALDMVATINQHAKIILIDQNLAIKAGEIRLQEGLRAIDSFTYAATLLQDATLVSGDYKHFRGKKNVILI